MSHCPDCKDTGYIGHDAAIASGSRAAGLSIPSPICSASLQIENFKNFRLDYYPDSEKNPVTGLTPRENIKRVLSSVKAFTDSFSHKEEDASSGA